MSPLRLSALVNLAVAMVATRVDGAPEFAPIFQDHAVLQREMPLPVWGRAAPGEHVSVSFAGQAVGATAGADGRWIAVLAPLAANPSGADLTATGKTSVALHDVVVGEVWFCGGQSGMELPVGDGSPAHRRDAEAAAAGFPLVRHFKVARQAAAAPMEGVPGDWKVCSPKTVGRFTAVGYYFARELFTRLGVPIGIINCTWTDAPLDAWMSPAALASLPGSAARPLPAPDREGPWIPSSLFNGMIHPLLPYAVRGVLWFEGEGTMGRAADYALQFPALVTAWRAHLGEGDVPFFWVQLPDSGRAAEKGEPWAYLREAQARALSLPATGQAVAIDVGGAGDLTPMDRQEVGRRLALIAKARVYSIPVDYSGPAFSRATAEGAAMRVHFLFAGEGLTASGKPLQSFEIAGADRIFHPASAVIQGESVLVRSPAVRQPVAVRYAWRNAPEANLYNGAGLPAAPFRSDDW